MKNTKEKTIICQNCEWTVSGIKTIAKSELAYQALRIFWIPICTFVMPKKGCLQLETNYARLMLNNFLERALDPPRVCVNFGLCSPSILNEDSDEAFRERVLGSKPPLSRPSPHGPPVRFAVITDIHIDFQYAEGSEAWCSYPSCCRKSTDDFGPILKLKSQKAGKFGSVANCDIPFVTFQSFFDYIEKMPEMQRPEFVIWLGDNSHSHTWEETKDEHLLALKAVAKTLKQRFSTIGSVYPLMGNHEGFPCDQYEFKKSKWILEEAAEEFRQWFTPENYQLFRKTGCFSQLHPGTNLRLIGLSPFVSNTMNSYYWKNSTNLLGVLDWFEAQLASSERDREAVFVLNHFPPNNYFMQRQWGYRYSILLERYSNIIRGNFAGHTHEDSFQVIQSKDDSGVAAVIFINPPLTTYHVLNPSFRVYTMAKNNHVLMDYEQYRMMIEESNSANSPIWRLRYTFSKLFGIQNFDLDQFPLAVKKMQQNETFFKEVMDLYWCDGPRGKEMLQESPDAIHFLSCKFLSADLTEISKCAAWNYPNLEYLFGYGILPFLISPPWAYDSL